MKVTFDFDSTLSRPEVQDYAKELINYKMDVWVLTSRFDELNKHKYPHNPTNEDLYAVTDKLLIPREKIRFTNMRPKAEYLEGTRVLWHLDDDDVELYDIRRLTKTIGVNSLEKDWHFKCDDILFNNHINFKVNFNETT